MGRGTSARCAEHRRRRRSRADATMRWSPPCAAATTAPSSCSTRATSAASTPTSRDGQGPRPRRGRDAGGLRLRAAADARDRAADRVQAVDLRDRQERLHRPVPPLQARRGGLARRRRGARARATTAALVGAGPRPTPRSPPSRTLDDLCGAFGGLSETHHEILVLRELEGLSYREIGDRMGMSRPAVESTLFRARRRLTEEYDELASGARCQRVQGDHRGGRRGAAGRARHAPPRAPPVALPALPPRGARRRAGLAILAHVPLRQPRALPRSPPCSRSRSSGRRAGGRVASARRAARPRSARAGRRTCRCSPSSSRAAGSWPPRPPSWWRASAPAGVGTHVVPRR